MGFALLVNLMYSQVVINELDSDTEGIDDKEFVELKTDTPFASLDDYVLVFFNGSDSGGNKSYLTLDLEGYQSDINGIFLIGSTNVEPFPQYLIPVNSIQNGADAVGIYYGDEDDFPDWTLATTDNLIDALVYGTDDPVSEDLLDLLGQEEQIDEDVHGNKDFESIQRNPDGSYFVGPSTPRANNDGSGVVLNGIRVDIPEDEYHEGDDIDIGFETDAPVAQDLELNFILTNYSFNQEDYTGETSVTIPQGETTASTTIHIVEDGETEGGEIMIFKFDNENLSPVFMYRNDDIRTRIIDNDFVVQDFGTPLNPTYGLVESTQPEDYYDSLDGLSGDALRQAIQDIVSDPDVVRVQTYADIIDILKQADQNPENSNEVWLVYTEQGRSKLDFQHASVSAGTWNREHTYPRSRGGFVPREGDEIPDGPDVYWITGPDSLRQGYSEAHALRAVDGPENSSRNNKNYGPAGYAGPEGTAGSFKGDVARAVLFLTVRFNGLEVVNGYPSTDPQGKLGDLETLIQWNQMDPPDDFEMNRNNVVYTWQRNRNPFIDYPDLIDYLWGDHAGETWHQPDMSVQNQDSAKCRIYPNPAKHQLYVDGIDGKGEIQIFTMDGRQVLHQSISGDAQLDIDLASGIYLVKITSDDSSIAQKLIVE